MTRSKDKTKDKLKDKPMSNANTAPSHKARYEAAQLSLSQVTSRFGTIEKLYLEQKERAETAEVALAEAQAINEELALRNEQLKQQLLSAEYRLSTTSAHSDQSGRILAEKDALLSAKDARIHELETAHRAKDAQIEQIVSSVSFRLGKRLTETAKTIPGVGKK